MQEKLNHQRLREERESGDRKEDLKLSKNLTTDELVDSVITHVSAYSGVDRRELVGKNREASVSLPRQTAMYLMYELGREIAEPISLSKIGSILGWRDRTTIMYGIQKVRTLYERRSDPYITSLIDVVELGLRR